MLSDQSVFLYIGSAAATVKPEFLRALRGAAITGFPHHRDIEAAGRNAKVAEAFRACNAEGFGRVIVVVDIGADGYQYSIALGLRGLSEAHESGFLGRLQTVEFFLSLETESEAQSLAQDIVPTVASFRTAPYVKVYMPVSDGPMGSQSGLTDFLAALTLAAPSRMAGVGEGLSAIRNCTESALFLAAYGESSLPDIDVAAKLFVDQTILDETFLSPDKRANAAPSMDRIERLLAAHHVGHEEPTVMSGFDFEHRRAKYRDALLHPLMSQVVRYFPEEQSLVEALDRLAAQVCNQSEALASILADVRNDLISARNRTTSGLAALRVESLGLHLKETLRTIVKLLVRQYGFAVWPLLARRARPLPNAVGVEDLDLEYEKCISFAVDGIRDFVAIDLRNRQESVRSGMAAIAARLPGPWRCVPKSFVLVPEKFTTDRRDELWPKEHRCGWLGLLQRELLV